MPRRNTRVTPSCGLKRNSWLVSSAQAEIWNQKKRVKRYLKEMGRKGLYKVGACERKESCVGGSGYASVSGRVGGRNNNRPDEKLKMDIRFHNTKWNKIREEKIVLTRPKKLRD